jgi:hypothetical protein
MMNPNGNPHQPNTTENSPSFKQNFSPHDLQHTCGVLTHLVKYTADHTE